MIRGSAAAFAVLVITTVLLSGCGEVGASERPLSPSPATPHAVFESREDAVSQARRTYLKYLQAVADASRIKQPGTERLRELVTFKQLKEEESGIDYLRTHKIGVEGATRLIKFELQSVNLTSGAITAYACVDFRQARLVDGQGKDVTPSTRKDQQTSVARFVWRFGRPLLEENVAWSGQSIC